VHDTAASTLLMVGLGEVRGDERWLAAQIRRDIDALADRPVESTERRSLSQVLTGVVRRAIVDVHLELPRGEPVPVPPPVGVAIEGAVGEALENVRRHAGTDRAVVRLVESPGRVVVTVSDSGAGFDLAAVPASRHGLVLSVRERMARAGGRAEVRSAPGIGTVVELEWADG
jgi:signal transduction histidine kinase